MYFCWNSCFCVGVLVAETLFNASLSVWILRERRVSKVSLDHQGREEWENQDPK